MACLAGALPALGQTKPTREWPSAPVMRTPVAERPIEWTAAQVRARVQGTLAVTQLTLTFRNPNTRVLEGQLEFPLRPGQDVTGLALQSLDGPQMIPAAVVDKTRARQALEQTIRATADPALVEQTEGRHFRLRVYPLVPGQARQVRLEITETLRPGRDGWLTFAPPTGPAGPGAPRPDVHLEIDGATAASLARPGPEPGAWRWKPAATPQVVVEAFEGQRYFLAEVPWRVSAAMRPPPARIVLVWDASGSAAQRDRGRELQVLDAYLRSLGRVAVTLVVARDRAEPPREFDVRGGRWDALRNALEGAVPDGASNPAAWLPPPGLDPRTTVALLVSDGLANWGEAGPLPAASVPLHTLSAAPGADVSRLQALSASSPGGRHLDLLSVDARQAVRALQEQPASPVLVRSFEARELQVDASRLRDGVLQVAGVLGPGQARVEIEARGADGTLVRRQVEIPADATPGRAAGTASSARAVTGSGPSAGTTSAAAGLAARRWASLRVQALEVDRRLHRAEITRLGVRFGLVTAWTSLLVLDALEDHLRFDIPPPAGPMREQFLARRRGVQQSEAAERSRHLDGLAARWRARAQWWEQDFPKGAPPPKVVTFSQVADPNSQEELHFEVASGPPRRAPAAQAAPAAAGAAAAPLARALAATPAADSPAGTPGAAMRVQRWQPSAQWAQRLRTADPAQRYAVYLDERPGQAGSPAFYLDAAEVFFEKGQTELGLRILSNLAELQLEDRRVLRVLAYRLLQAGQARLALPLLERVREIAPEEPQSWRDLGLALEAAGRLQDSLDALWETASRPWPQRFADIDLIALNELNALAVRHPELDVSRVDERVRRNLPVGLRVVLSWDADDTDIDLWVVDPNAELAYFAHPRTHQGGLMSRDFTAGYGPEEFVLRRPKPGRYEVRANFYGHRQQLIAPHTTLHVRLTTNFGEPGQRQEQIVLRLATGGDKVLVGTFDVPEPPQPAASQ